MSEKTDASAGAGDPNLEKGGADAKALLEKVGALIEEHTGLKLDDIFAEREKVAAATAAEEAGKKAQKTYDPKLTRLENELKRLGQENTDTKRQLREARIAAMPEAAREAARKLAEAEDANEGVREKEWRANEALRRAHAREFALDLKERGIAGFTYEDFLPFDSLEEMKEKFAEIRADFAENALKEAGKGTSGSTEKKPPASSTTPSRGKGGASGAGGAAGSTRTSGDKPWAEQTGKGLTDRNIADALRRMQEEDYTGVK
jgi:hypothetical protein